MKPHVVQTYHLPAQQPPVVCGWCHTWIKPPKVGQPQGLKVSHGICPKCTVEHFGAVATRADRVLARLRGWARAAGRALGEAVQRGGGLRRW